jgi:signal transduction histidine kinase
MSLLRVLCSRLRRPRHSVRLRLTLLYCGLFLASGAGLLAITYLLVLRSTANYLFTFNSRTNRALFLATQSNAPIKERGIFFPAQGLRGKPPTAIPPAQAQAQIHQIQAQVAQQHADVLHQLLVQSGIALTIMAVLAIGLGWLVAGRVLGPLRTITAAVRHISASNLHERLALDGPDDEIKELGDTFDGLLGRLESAFEAQRRFVANASHELRTPLTRQRTLVEVALDDPEATLDSLRASYARVLAAVEQQERLIEALLTLARGERGLERRESFDLAAVTAEVLRARSPELQRRALHIDATLTSAATAGDPRLVERLVANLVDNAMRHNVAAGQISVATGTGAGYAMLAVIKSGPVIPAAALARLFQPFQRLGADRTAHRDGMGLGLSIVQAITVAHGATLTVRAQPEGGLAIEVRFPSAGGAIGHVKRKSTDTLVRVTHDCTAVT